MKAILCLVLMAVLAFFITLYMYALWLAIVMGMIGLSVAGIFFVYYKISRK